MDEKDKRRYAYGGLPPAGNLCIQSDSDLICDDLVEELATIPTSMLLMQREKPLTSINTNHSQIFSAHLLEVRMPERYAQTDICIAMT